MKAIYLTGFMGSGKTTIGKLLSEQLNIDVYDTDHYIEGKLNNPIPMIFEKSGEDYFRYQEKAALQELPTENVIITTGGGIILQKDNRDWMKEHGLLFFLHCQFNELWERIQHDTNRPLANQRPMNEVKKLYQTRLPLYREAQIILDTTNKTKEQVVKEALTWIKVYLGGNTN
jgi:shikimate kinase